MTNAKKDQAKEKMRLMKQFDQVGESVTQSSAKIAKEANENVETAGSIRKQERSKNKKEKTLGAKLRLKAKKNR